MALQISNNWKRLSAFGPYNFGTDVFRIILMEPGFTFDRANHEEYTDVSANELPGGGGYAVGGLILTGVVVTNDPILAATTIIWDNVTWAVTIDLQTAGAIIFDDTLAGPDVDPIVGFIDFSGTLTTYAGGTFTIANVAVAYT